jgi:O-antigen ligase
MGTMGKFWLAAGAVVVLAAVCVFLILKGSRLGPIEAGVVALSPLLVYFSLTRPLVVPYALYVMLLPFDNVLAVSSGATLTKFIGIFSTGAILLWAIGQRKFVAPSVTLWLGALLMVWLASSMLWALDIRASFSIVPTYLGLFVLYIVLSIAPVSRKDFVIIMCAMVVGSLGAAAWGVYFFHGQSVADAQALASNFGRLTVHIGDNTIDPNAYSDAIILPFCILLMLGLQSRFIPAKLGALAGLALMLAAIYVSASRGAILAISTAAVWLIIRSRYRLQILFLLVVPATIAFLSSSLIVERFQDPHHTGGAGRFGIWNVGMEAFRQHWLTGAGIGNYSAVYNSVFMRVYQAYSGGWDRVAHNLIVQVSAELGIIGLILVLAFWFSNLFLLQHIRPDNEWYDLRLALEAAVLGLFVASLSVDLIWFKYSWLLFGTIAQLRSLTVSSIVPIPKRRAAVMSDMAWGTRPVRRRFQERGA